MAKSTPPQATAASTPPPGAATGQCDHTSPQALTGRLRWQMGDNRRRQTDQEWAERGGAGHGLKEEGRARPVSRRRPPAPGVRPTVGVVGAGESDAPWSGLSREVTTMTLPTRHLQQ